MTKLQAMCHKWIESTLHVCLHKIDYVTVLDLDGCNDCGVIQKTTHLRTGVKDYPCDACILSGAWVRRNLKWEKVGIF